MSDFYSDFEGEGGPYHKLNEGFSHFALDYTPDVSEPAKSQFDSTFKIMRGVFIRAGYGQEVCIVPVRVVQRGRVRECGGPVVCLAEHGCMTPPTRRRAGNSILQICAAFCVWLVTVVPPQSSAQMVPARFVVPCVFLGAASQNPCPYGVRSHPGFWRSGIFPCRISTHRNIPLLSPALDFCLCNQT